MYLRTPLVASVFVLSAQTAIAAKPLPCPKDSPVLDLAQVIRADTRTAVDARLRSLNTEKRHQVVVVTVPNTKDYGFSTIEEMGRTIGNGCWVGVKWENTGVVLLHTKEPRLFRIDTANTERYLTDVQSGKVIDNSRTVGKCQKEDVSCRVNYITSAIDGIIRKEFDSKQAVQDIEDARVRTETNESAKRTREIWNTIAGGLAGLWLLVWGSFAGLKVSRKLKRRNQIAEIRNEIQNALADYYAGRKGKDGEYPEWHLDRHAKEADMVASQLKGLSDDEIYEIVSTDRGRAKYARQLKLLRATPIALEQQFALLLWALSTLRNWLQTLSEGVFSLEASLQKEGFVLKKMPAVSMPKGLEDMYEEVTLMHEAMETLHKREEYLSVIPRLYKDLKGFNDVVRNELEELLSQYTNISTEYTWIFWGRADFDETKLEKRIETYLIKFNEAYKNKDISQLETIVKERARLFGTLKNTIDSMVNSINWFKDIPNEVESREKALQEIPNTPKIIADAKAWSIKTGDNSYGNFSLKKEISELSSILSKVTSSHNDRVKLEEIYTLLANFDAQFAKVYAYVHLGDKLAIMIRQEEEAKQLAERRRKDEEQRREDEERRARDASTFSAISSSDSTSTPSNNWNLWGGSEFKGGGATRD